MSKQLTFSQMKTLAESFLAEKDEDDKDRADKDNKLRNRLIGMGLIAGGIGLTGAARAMNRPYSANPQGSEPRDNQGSSSNPLNNIFNPSGSKQPGPTGRASSGYQNQIRYNELIKEPDKTLKFQFGSGSKLENVIGRLETNTYETMAGLEGLGNREGITPRGKRQRSLDYQEAAKAYRSGKIDEPTFLSINKKLGAISQQALNDQRRAEYLDPRNQQAMRNLQSGQVMPGDLVSNRKRILRGDDPSTLPHAGMYSSDTRAIESELNTDRRTFGGRKTLDQSEILRNRSNAQYERMMDRSGTISNEKLLDYVSKLKKGLTPTAKNELLKGQLQYSVKNAVSQNINPDTIARFQKRYIPKGR